MENQTLKFKTNINCGSCVAAVKPHLDKAEGVISWTVDTDNADKILSIETDVLNAESIQKILKKTGFSVEPLN